MASKPKEDPVEQRERLRQRRVAALDRRRAAKDNAASLTSDIRSVFGVGGLSMFGGSKPTAVRSAPAPRATLPTGTPGQR